MVIRIEEIVLCFKPNLGALYPVDRGNDFKIDHQNGGFLHGGAVWRKSYWLGRLQHKRHVQPKPLGQLHSIRRLFSYNEFVPWIKVPKWQVAKWSTFCTQLDTPENQGLQIGPQQFLDPSISRWLFSTISFKELPTVSLSGDAKASVPRPSRKSSCLDAQQRDASKRGFDSFRKTLWQWWCFFLVDLFDMFLARCFEFERAIPGLDRFGEGSFCLKTHNCPYSISSLGLGHKPGFLSCIPAFSGIWNYRAHTRARTYI